MCLCRAMMAERVTRIECELRELWGAAEHRHLTVGCERHRNVVLDNASSAPYSIEYGPTGFTPGTGTVIDRHRRVDSARLW